MSLNELRLSSSLVAMLYPNSLLDMGNDDATQVPNKPVGEQKIDEETKALKWLGNNQKNILIVVRYNDIVHLPDDELKFLTGILTACKLSLDDVAIINTNNYKRDGYNDILAEFKSRIVFL